MEDWLSKKSVTIVCLLGKKLISFKVHEKLKTFEIIFSPNAFTLQRVLIF